MCSCANQHRVQHGQSLSGDHSTRTLVLPVVLRVDLQLREFLDHLVVRHELRQPTRRVCHLVQAPLGHEASQLLFRDQLRVKGLDLVLEGLETIQIASSDLREVRHAERMKNYC